MGSSLMRGNIVDVEDVEQTFQAADYNYVAKHAKLIGLHMISSDFRIRPSFFARRNDVRLGIDNDILACTPNTKDGVCIGVFEFVVKGKIGRSDAFKCSAQIVAAYSIPHDAEVEATEAFCSKVGLFATYPYFRAHLANIASAANADLPPLPMLASVSKKRTTLEATADRSSSDEVASAPAESTKDD